MTSSGVPLVEAMRIGSEVIGNRYLRERVVEAAQRVSEGTSLHSALLEVGHFPPLMLHMIASGEASGELDNMLARIAQQQEMEIERLVTTAVRLFEPLMLVLMGVVVLTIVMSILMPIMEMNNMVGQ
jgi:general secretion pathway protein F